MLYYFYPEIKGMYDNSHAASASSRFAALHRTPDMTKIMLHPLLYNGSVTVTIVPLR